MRDKVTTLLLLLAVAASMASLAAPGADEAAQPSCSPYVIARSLAEFESLGMQSRGADWRPDGLDENTFEQFDFHAVAVFLTSGSMKIEAVRIYEDNGAYSVRYKVHKPAMGTTDIKLSTVWALVPRNATTVELVESNSRRGARRSDLASGAIERGGLNASLHGSTFCVDAQEYQDSVAGIDNMPAADNVELDRHPVDIVIKPDPAYPRITDYYTLSTPDRSFTVYLASKPGPGELWLINAQDEQRLVLVNESWHLFELEFARVEDFNRDGDDELIVSASFATGIGPDGGKLFERRFVIGYHDGEWTATLLPQGWD